MLKFLAWALEELRLGVNLVSYKSPLDFTPNFDSSFGEGIVSKINIKILSLTSGLLSFLKACCK